ncbi:MAG: acyl-CoA dehydrogenase family protein [Gammaproteobacteria bacterium]|jgi:alkylation response protein AidB-like acyl-CoA dehydrogenase
MSDAFFQEGPHLGNQFVEDAVLTRWLERNLPPEVREEVTPGLESLGERVVDDILAMAVDAEANEPRHVPYDPWGRRVDDIETSLGWELLETAAAEEAIVATAYQRRHGAWSRVHQFARLYLYHPSSAIYSCPLAMTDGAARVMETLAADSLRERVLPHLISTDPETFWTSGQWMTERTGGSDVSGSETVARADGDGWRLYGDKWFTSATTSQVTLTLARADDGEGPDERLSLFFLELRDEQGRLNGIRINRLKDKLGTRALPTAELTLDGTRAVMVGERGRGVRNIATVLNITRLYNACCAVGYMRRGIALARDYAERREAFGRRLCDQPLHVRTLAGMDAEFRGAFALVFWLAELMGRDECGEADARDRALLRLLTPLAKLYTGKQSVAVVSEVLECFGGAGYVEDTGLPALLRDAQVLTIWEGTTNVLSLDMLRVLGSGDSGRHWLAEMEERLQRLEHARLEHVKAVAADHLEHLGAWLESLGSIGRDQQEAEARDLAYSLARVTELVLVAEQAQWELEHCEDPQAAVAAAWHWANRHDLVLD